ncbi:MAG: hypothetical protein IPO04_00970 [Cytophagaceae bacterium]|nr:hypothetical protein [Cytophagaceae bacterium]
MKKAMFYLLAIPMLAGDVFQELGINATEGQSYFFNSVTLGSTSFPGGAAKIPNDQKVRVIRFLGEYFRKYYKTEDFKGRYDTWWKEQEPEKPETPEQRLAREKLERENQEKEGERNALKVKSSEKANCRNQRRCHEKTAAGNFWKKYLKIQKQLTEPLNNPEFKKQMKEMETCQKQAYEEEYKLKAAEDQTDLGRWNAIKNPDVLLKEKLEEFLHRSADIDFSAKLKEQYGHKVFVNPGFESKDSFWKLCFRAGKPAMEAARAIAIEWLGEMK